MMAGIKWGRKEGETCGHMRKRIRKGKRKKFFIEGRETATVGENAEQRKRTRVELGENLGRVQRGKSFKTTA